MTTRPAQSESGYALIVIAALFTAFATVAALMLDRNVVTAELDRQKIAQAQVSRLASAIANYARYNGGRYPCPAPMDTAYTDTTFGAAAGNCVASVPSGLTALTSGGCVGNACKIVRGMIPVRSLVAYGAKAPDDAIDPWGSRIQYSVHRELTSAGSGDSSSYPASIFDYISNTALSVPHYVIVSLGRDRTGATLKNGTTVVAACASSTDRRLENCDTDATFLRGPLNLSATTQADIFDDTISSYAYTGTVSAPSNCEIGAVATWNGVANGCSHTLTTSLANGASRSENNTASFRTGSATLTCTGGTLSTSSPSCSYLCGVEGVMWGHNNGLPQNCTGTTTSGTNGQVITVNADAPYSGTSDWECNGSVGAWGLRWGATCTP